MEDSDYNQEYEANEDELSVQQAPARAQGYLYEPRISQERFLSDESEESAGSDSELDDIDERVGNTDWCECGVCTSMPTRAESRCCREISAIEVLADELQVQCITRHPGFEGNCLNPYVIETSFYEFLDGYAHVGDDEPIHELYRYIAYRRFTRWVWHVLGRGVRRVIPSCAVHKIRDSWPSEEYTGFKYRRHY